MPGPDAQMMPPLPEGLFPTAASTPGDVMRQVFTAPPVQVRRRDFAAPPVPVPLEERRSPLANPLPHRWLEDAAKRKGEADVGSAEPPYVPLQRVLRETIRRRENDP